MAAPAEVGPGEVQVSGFIEETLGESNLVPPVVPCQRDSGRVGHGVAEGPVVVVAGTCPVAGGASTPAITCRNQYRSASERWRTSPSNDRSEGSTERQAMARASKPAHLSSSVSR